MPRLSPDVLYPTLWLSIQGIGQQTISKIAIFLNKKRLSWQISFNELSTLLKYKIISLDQYDQTKKQLPTLWTAKTLSQKLSEANISVINQKSPFFPPLLAATQQAPHLLFFQGKRSLLAEVDIRPAVAVVGTRQITPYGKLVTRKITEELVSNQAIVISGGMYGVDAEAHRAALESGGHTICVLGSGLARSGPYWQQALLAEILANEGLVLSEFFPWTPAHKSHFPMRNRIVAGLSKAVVVAEAAVKSGSLITAQFALEYGREVCTIPGSIFSPYSQGTAWLINQGATLVSSGEEVLETFTSQMSSHQPKVTSQNKPPGLSTLVEPAVVTILKSVGGTTTQEIASQLEVPVTEALLQLSNLELRGLITTEGGRWYLAS